MAPDQAFLGIADAIIDLHEPGRRPGSDDEPDTDVGDRLDGLATACHEQWAVEGAGDRSR